MTLLANIRVLTLDFRRFPLRTAVWLGFVGLAACLGSVRGRGTDESTADSAHFFETRIRPLLVDRCHSCHGSKVQQGDLRLDSQAAILRGGESGPAIVPFQPEASLLIDAVRYRSLEMPPDTKLSASDVEALTTWVAAGALWPNSPNSPNSPNPPNEALTPRPAGVQVTAEDRAHWAFQPLHAVTVPQPAQLQTARTPLDAFLLQRLEDRGLGLSPLAPPRQQIRRLSVDITGLPPEWDEMSNLETAEDVDSTERLIDRLLASPRYGEKSARQWLDLVRFAQTDGYERDAEKPFIWRYRDYVIRSANGDKPFDEFVREQIAGDELDTITHESLIATGFYHLAVWDDEPDDKTQAIHDGLDDILRTISESVMGLTIGCARCHDHKFDPIRQTDYYRLIAHFANLAPYGKDKSSTHWEIDPNGAFLPLLDSASMAAWRERCSSIDREIDATNALLHETSAQQKETSTEHKENKETSAEQKETRVSENEAAAKQKQELEKKLAELKKRRESPAFEQAMAVRERSGTIPATRVLIRGSPLTPGEEVDPGFPEVFDHWPIPSDAADLRRSASGPGASSDFIRSALRELQVPEPSGRRRQFAAWLLSDNNPLVPRVAVNRIWKSYFGRGIVATTSDFGRAGQSPTHPELLDWFAKRFVDGSWQRKRMERLLLLSQAYLQSSSARTPMTEDVDPTNELLGRQTLRRMDAETIRDAILQTSGKLDLEMYGRGIFPQLSQEVLLSQTNPGAGWDKSTDRARSRRSIYIYIKRTLGVPMMETFDTAPADKPIADRTMTTIAPQALTLLNSEFMQEQASALAQELISLFPDSVDNRLRAAVERVLLRAVDPAELHSLHTFHGRRVENLLGPDSPGKSDAERLAMLDCCRLLLNLNEFLYVD